jgi:hypothetical protein
MSKLQSSINSKTPKVLISKKQKHYNKMKKILFYSAAIFALVAANGENILA